MKRNTQMDMLLRTLPRISEDEARNIDRWLKDKLSSQTNGNLLDELTEELIKKMVPYVKSKVSTKDKKRCKKVVAYYMNNEDQYTLQENWFCLLAYLISLCVMIFRILDVSTKCNDFLSLFTFMGALIIWLVLVKFKCSMSDKAKLWLNSFNRFAPSMTIVGSLLFYSFICYNFFKPAKTWILVIIVLGSFVVTVCCTIRKYK
jgi:hypothetical protein